MAPVESKMKNPTWTDLVNKCLSQRISLSEKAVYVSSKNLLSRTVCRKDINLLRKVDSYKNGH